MHGGESGSLAIKIRREERFGDEITGKVGGRKRAMKERKSPTPTTHKQHSCNDKDNDDDDHEIQLTPYPYQAPLLTPKPTPERDGPQ